MNRFFYSLVDFILYGAAFLCNILVVFCTPVIYANDFLFVYSTTSLFFGIFIVLVFGIDKLARISPWILFCMIFFLGAYLFFQNNFLLWLVYAITLLVSDYIASQKGGRLGPKLNRFINILSALPFYFFPKAFLELIILRTVLFSLISFMIISNNRPFTRLKLKSPYFYVISTHLFYFLPLIIVSNYFDGKVMKFWYLGFQIGLGSILKFMDYSIRKNSQKNELINLTIILVVASIPTMLMLSNPNFFLLIIYLVSSIFLLNLKFKISKNE